MRDNMKHLRKLAGIAVVMLVIYNLWIYNLPKLVNGASPLYLTISLGFGVLFWPVYLFVLLILCFYYFWSEGNRPYALNVFFTMLLVVLFGCYSCYGVR
jgi:hypothetical protein